MSREREKKTPFILVSILLCAFMGRCITRTVGSWLLVPLAAEWSARPAFDGASARSALEDWEYV